MMRFWRRKPDRYPPEPVPHTDAVYGDPFLARPVPSEAPPPRRKRRRWIVRILAILLLVFIILVAWLAWTAPLGKSLEPLETPALLIEAADGSAIARRGPYKGAPVVASELPAHIPNAFIAIEDRRFNDHMGIDLRGIARAMSVNMKEGGFVQGGSTITQQLAKTSFLSAERSLKRKGQEALIALWLEAWLSKDEILSRYMSSVYFGDGAYGLRAAAMQYFSKQPNELTLGEAAMLAGLMKAPSRLAPTKNYDGARARGKLVIAAMKDQQLISEAEWNGARRAQMKPGRTGLPGGSYFADWIFPAAADYVGDVYGEVRVRTTLDPQLQRAAERILKQRLARSSASQGALVAMRPDGRIVAMVGGIDYAKSGFNRAVQAQRQSGSAFKPFVYWAALREGMSPDDLVSDAALAIGDWTPSNYDGRFGGDITLTQAFAKSSNVAAARLTEEVGPRAVRRAARDLGIESGLVDDHTIALGTSETNLLELTSAYAAFAGGRYPVKPYAIEDSERPRTRVVPRLRDMRTLLRAVVDQGTGRIARLPVPAFAKTGTTQDYRDALFIGFIDDLVVGVWVGNDDNSATRGVTGSNVPAEIWRDFVIAASPEVRSARQRRLPPPEETEPAIDIGDLIGGGLDRDLVDWVRGDREAGERLAERAMRGEFDNLDIEERAEELAREGAIRANEAALEEIERALEQLEDDAEDARRQ
ncbi:MAG: transglycosylase domain-containing protein [Pacificimonas sp.]